MAANYSGSNNYKRKRFNKKQGGHENSEYLPGFDQTQSDSVPKPAVAVPTKMPMVEFGPARIISRMSKELNSLLLITQLQQETMSLGHVVKKSDRCAIRVTTTSEKIERMMASAYASTLTTPYACETDMISKVVAGTNLMLLGSPGHLQSYLKLSFPCADFFEGGMAENLMSELCKNLEPATMNNLVAFIVFMIVDSLKDAGVNFSPAADVAMPVISLQYDESIRVGCRNVNCATRHKPVSAPKVDKSELLRQLESMAGLLRKTLATEVAAQPTPPGAEVSDPMADFNDLINTT